MANDKKATDSREVTYRAAVLTCALAGKLLAEHDLPAVLEAIERAEAAGPVLNPTLWKERHKAMLEDKEIVQAALPLRALAVRVQQSVGGRIFAESQLAPFPKKNANVTKVEDDDHE